MEIVDKLKTPLGYIKIEINNNEVKFAVNTLEKIDIFQNEIMFDVDERYFLIAEVPNLSKLNIKCFIDEIKMDAIDTESGERYEMISFYLNNLKLSIGAQSRGEEDFDNINYLNNGLELLNYNEWNRNNIIFGVAWKILSNSEVEDEYVREAAIP